MKTKSEIIDIALNAACKAVQESIGTNDGGLAGSFFQGRELEQFNSLFGRYVALEIESSERAFIEFQKSRRVLFSYQGCEIEIVDGVFQVTIGNDSETFTDLFAAEKHIYENWYLKR